MPEMCDQRGISGLVGEMESLWSDMQTTRYKKSQPTFMSSVVENHSYQDHSRLAEAEKQQNFAFGAHQPDLRATRNTAFAQSQSHNFFEARTNSVSDAKLN